MHGDLSSGNILVSNNQLNAIIDFGGMTIGDPACDLVIAWTFLNNESQNVFKSNLNLNPKTWARARGWALWKSLITIIKDGSETQKQLKIIDSILIDHKNNLTT